MNWKNPIAAVVVTSALASAYASSFTAPFPSDSSTVVASVGVVGAGEYGYFWSVNSGDAVSQIFSGTGLNQAVGLDLNFDVTQNVLNRGASVLWDVLVNGVDVGDWSWSDGQGTGPVALSYAFGPVAATGIDTFEIAMVVANEVPGGQGSIAISYAGANSQYTPSMTLTGDRAGVPDAASTLALFGLAMTGLLVSRRHARG